MSVSLHQALAFSGGHESIDFVTPDVGKLAMTAKGLCRTICTSLLLYGTLDASSQRSSSQQQKMLQPIVHDVALFDILISGAAPVPIPRIVVPKKISQAAAEKLFSSSSFPCVFVIELLFVACSSIHSVAKLQLAQFAPNLRLLSFKDCLCLADVRSLVLAAAEPSDNMKQLLLPHLSTLDLSGTGVTDAGLEGVVEKLPNLSKLLLADTQRLEHPGKVVSGDGDDRSSSRISVLDLCRNRDCSNKNNSAAWLCGIERLPSLTVLDLSFNDTLRGALRPEEEASLSRCVHLKRLDLSHNPLLFATFHPDDPELCRQLEITSIGRNLRGLAGLPSIVNLDLSFTHVRSVRELGAVETSTLRILNLTGSKATSVNGLELLPHLEVLKICNTDIYNLECLAASKSLVVIEADNSMLETCDGLESIDTLQVFHANACSSLESVSALCKSKSLIQIHMRSCLLLRSSSWESRFFESIATLRECLL